MHEELSENHRRTISSGMLIVDTAVGRMLALLEDRNSPGTISAVEGSVNEDEKEQIRIGLKQLQRLIASLVEKYDLRLPKKNLRRILAAELSQIWVTLEDCRPARIRGYGAMSAAHAKSLEADLQEILRVADGLQALLNS